jgi:hypothetical protein
VADNVKEVSGYWLLRCGRSIFQTTSYVPGATPAQGTHRHKGRHKGTVICCNLCCCKGRYAARLLSTGQARTTSTTSVPLYDQYPPQQSYTPIHRVPREACPMRCVHVACAQQQQDLHEGQCSPVISPDMSSHQTLLSFSAVPLQPTSAPTSCSTTITHLGVQQPTPAASVLDVCHINRQASTTRQPQAHVLHMAAAVAQVKTIRA